MRATLTRLVGRGLELTALALAVLSAAGMTMIVVLVVLSVVMRKLVNAPFFFTEELVGLLMGASLFLALPMVTLRADHVRVTIVENALRPGGRAVLAGLAALLGLGFCAWLAAEAVPWLEFAIRLNLQTETSRLLLYPWMAVLPLSVILTGVVYAARLLGLLPETKTAPADQIS